MTWTRPLNQQIWLGATFGLSVLTILLIVLSVRQWLADWQLTHPKEDSLHRAVLVKQSPRLAQSLLAQHLFGLALPKGQVPTTNLQLQVTGIVKSYGMSSPGFSKAYISIAGQPSKIFQVGEHLPYGVKVYDIESQTVILENNGRLEKLPLAREPLKFNSIPTINGPSMAMSNS